MPINLLTDGVEMLFKVSGRVDNDNILYIGLICGDSSWKGALCITAFELLKGRKESNWEFLIYVFLFRG